MFNGQDAWEQAQNAREGAEARAEKKRRICEFGCTGKDENVHYNWYRCTPESRAILAKERGELEPVEYVIGEIRSTP